MTPTDPEVYAWIESHSGKWMTKHLLDEHKRLLVEPDGRGFLPGDLDKIIQTVKHAKACIIAGHEPLSPENGVVSTEPEWRRS
jgi:hypothetical protein